MQFPGYSLALQSKWCKVKYFGLHTNQVKTFIFPKLRIGLAVCE